MARYVISGMLTPLSAAAPVAILTLASTGIACTGAMLPLR